MKKHILTLIATLLIVQLGYAQLPMTQHGYLADVKLTKVIGNKSTGRIDLQLMFQPNPKHFNEINEYNKFRVVIQGAYSNNRFYKGQTYFFKDMAEDIWVREMVNGALYVNPELTQLDLLQIILPKQGSDPLDWIEFSNVPIEWTTPSDDFKEYTFDPEKLLSGYGPTFEESFRVVAVGNRKTDSLYLICIGGELRHQMSGIIVDQSGFSYKYDEDQHFNYKSRCRLKQFNKSDINMIIIPFKVDNQVDTLNAGIIWRSAGRQYMNHNIKVHWFSPTPKSTAKPTTRPTTTTKSKSTTPTKR